MPFLNFRRQSPSICQIELTFHLCSRNREYQNNSNNVQKVWVFMLFLRQHCSPYWEKLFSLVMPYDVILYFYTFMIEGVRGLARVINKVLDFVPLQYLCILATRPKCSVVCTGNMY